MQVSNAVNSYYDPKNVTFLIGGVDVVEYAEDTAIVISRENNRINPKAGVDGSVALSRNRNALGTVTISLKNTSPTNRQLIQFYTEEENGNPWFPVTFDDPSSGMALDTEGWIQVQPDFTIGSEVGTMEWVIGVANAAFSKSQTEQASGSLSIDVIAKGVIA